MIRKSLSLAALALTVIFAVPALPSTFWPGKVINVPSGDRLNVRRWPAAHSEIIYSFRNGARISMTGRCNNTSNKTSFYITGSQSSSWKHNKIRQPHIWCQVMSPEAQLGWVRGRYVWPD